MLSAQALISLLLDHGSLLTTLEGANPLKILDRLLCHKWWTPKTLFGRACSLGQWHPPNYCTPWTIPHTIVYCSNLPLRGPNLMSTIWTRWMMNKHIPCSNSLHRQQHMIRSSLVHSRVQWVHIGKGRSMHVRQASCIHDCPSLDHLWHRRLQSSHLHSPTLLISGGPQ